MIHSISEVGLHILQYQEDLAKKYKYKPIPVTFFQDVRTEFEIALPDWCIVNGSPVKLETTEGTLVANGYNRIVIGDYGAFVEMTQAQVVMKNLTIKKGQEYRAYDAQYKDSVKYLWLTAKDTSDVKIYGQRKPVTYADYKPGMLYASVYEVFPTIR